MLSVQFELGSVQFSSVFVDLGSVQFSLTLVQFSSVFADLGSVKLFIYYRFQKK